MKKIFTLFVIAMYCLTLHAQTFPVSGTVQLTSANIPSLSGLVNPGQPAFFFTLLNTDITKPEMEVRLSISISGQGATLRSKQFAISQNPIRLQYGVPLILTGIDISEYFNPDNLDFFGITREEFLERGQLPEGIYSLCIEVFDYTRFEEQSISNNACGIGMILDHDPPIITSLIRDNSFVSPQNYTFSWQPMHVGAFPVIYNLQVYEWIDGLAMDQIFQLTPPVFQANTSALTYQYTVADPLLSADKEYIVRVRVSDLLSNAYFKNKGFSEAEVFELTLECTVGQPCNDGNACTINDTWTASCGCEGTLLPDFDGDGICDELDICPNGDDLADADGDCIPDACDDCQIGMECDDNDPCTFNDLYQINPENGLCECMGVQTIDSDHDGICDAEDDCQGGDDNIDVDNDGYPDACDDCVVGTPCDDNNPSTTGDIYVWNNEYEQGVPLPPGIEPCECIGQLIPCDLDSDGDGVCDDVDLCPGYDDLADADGDTIPDACDACPGYNDLDDADEDGIPDECDDRFDDKECYSTLQLILTEVEETLDLCNYCAPLDHNLATQGSPLDHYMIHTLTVYLPSGASKTFNANTPGFYFPYCSALDCQNHPSPYNHAQGIELLMIRFNGWAETNGFIGGLVHMPGGCETQGPALALRSTNMVAVSMQVQQVFMQDYFTVPFSNVGCNPETIRLQELSAGIVAEPCDEVSYLWSNGETSSSIYISGDPYEFSVTVTCANECVYTVDDAICVVGTPCDDNDPCTINDTYSNSCFCAGEYVGDEDNDSVCDVLDACPGGNDLQDSDNDGIPNDCDDDCSTVGEPCNDGNPCTTNDRLDERCDCVGTYGDSDNDGICDAMDQCPGYPDYEDFDLDGIPDACDEPICGEGLDGCETFELIAECDNIHVLNYQELTLVSQYYRESYSANPSTFITELESNDDYELETELQEYAIATGDTLYLYLDLDEFFDTAGFDNPLGDSDDDGIIDLIDMCPYDPSISALPPNGQVPDCISCDRVLRLMKYHFDRECDDDDECTVFDQFNCDCECEGVMLDADEDGICDLEDECPNGPNDEDADGDGIPDACDPQPCVAPGQSSFCDDDGDPCTINGVFTMNPDTGICECMESSIQVTSNCEGTGTCDGVWFRNTMTDECECIPASPFPDADGDGVCDAEDICNDGDDNDDSDNDGIPTACDLCENEDLPGAVGDPCDDGDECTIEDKLTILIDSNGLDSCGCFGVYIDSDDDGVCNAKDQCEGWPDYEDYNNDDIPDGCDPPYYEVGCPSLLRVVSSNSFGMVVHYDDTELLEEDIPSPLSITVAYVDPNTNEGALLEYHNLALAGFQVIDDHIEVYYSIPEMDLPALSHMGIFYIFSLAYSDYQTCLMGGRLIDEPIYYPNDDGAAFGCPSSFQSIGGHLSFRFTNPGTLPFDLNAIPGNIAIEGTGPGGSFSHNSEVIGLLPTQGHDITLETSIPYFNTSTSEFTVTIDGTIVCEYDTGNTVQLDCEFEEEDGTITFHYFGEACDDGLFYTDHDAYQIDTETGLCVCIGTIGHDQDGDGVHDALDQCPDFDDSIDVDMNGVPDGCECPEPLVSSTEIVNGADVEITLQVNEEHASYEVTYYPTDLPGSTSTETASTSPILIANLSSETNYTFEVVAICNTGNPSSAVPTTIDVPFDEESFYCGDIPDILLGEQTLLPYLLEGDIVIAGDFEVIITKVTSGLSGIFAGEGRIEVPFLNGAIVNVKFQAATINDEYVLIGGFMEVTGAGSDILLDIFGEDFADLLDDVIGFLEEVDDVLATLEELFQALESIVAGLNSCEEFYAELAGPGGGLTEMMNALEYLPEAEATAFEAALECCGDPNAVWDGPGGCKEQLQTAIENIQAALDELYNADYQINFGPGGTAEYGFDAYEYPALAGNYGTIAIDSQDYWIAWKAVPSASSDPVLAIKGDSTSFPTDLTFEFKPGDEVGHTNDQNNTVALSPKGEVGDGRVKTLLAVQRKSVQGQQEPEIHIAGKLQLVSYDDKQVDIILVPVQAPGGTAPNLSGVNWTDKLSAVFKQGVVTANVTVAEPLTVDGFDGVVNEIPADFNASFNADMALVKNTYLQTYSIPYGQQYVLFVVPDYENPSKAGYMPFNQRYGFIYYQKHVTLAAQNALPIEDVLTKTVAHEIGHGAFSLKHIFKEYPAIDSSTTNNLMDITVAGEHLQKYQWDAMHKEVEENSTGSAGDAEHTVVSVVDGLEDFRDSIDQTFTFITPSGLPITLPPNTTGVSFNTGDDLFSICSQNQFKLDPVGTLNYFVVNEGGTEAKYLSCYFCNDTEFSQYAKLTVTGVTSCADPSVVPYVDTFSINTPGDLTANPIVKPTFNYNRGIIGIPCVDENGEIIFTVDTVQIDPELWGLDYGNYSTTTNLFSEGHYKARGASLAFDFLSPGTNPSALYHFNPNRAKPIPGKSYPAYSAEAKEFLRTYSGWGGCYSPVSFYLMVHAHQISKYPGFFWQCGSNINSDFPVTPETDYSGYLLQNVLNAQELEANQLSVPSGGGLGNSYQYVPAEAAAMSAELVIGDWANAGMSYYRYFHEVKEGFIKPLLNQPTINESDRVKLYNVLRLFYKKYPCVLSSFTVDQRKNALNHMSAITVTGEMENDFMSKDNIIVALLATTDSNDYDEILNHLKGTDGLFTLYFTIVDKLNTWWTSNASFNSAAHEGFATTVSKMLAGTKSFTGTCEPVSGTNIPSCTFLDQSTTTDLLILGYNPSPIINPCPYDKFRVRTAAVTSSTPKKIYLKTPYWTDIADHSGNDDSDCTGFLGAEYDYNDKQDREAIGTPYETVAIVFGIDMSMTGPDGEKKTIKKGTTVYVPYVFADYLLKKINGGEISYLLRATGDAFALLGFLPSGGTTGVIAVTFRAIDLAGAAVGAFDLFVMNPDNYSYQMTNNSLFSQETHKIWSQFQNAVDDLGWQAFKVQLASGAIQFTLSKATKLFYNNVSPAQPQVPDLFETALRRQRQLLEGYYPDPNLPGSYQKWEKTLNYFKRLEACVHFTGSVRPFSATGATVTIQDYIFRHSTSTNKIFFGQQPPGGVINLQEVGVKVMSNDVPYFKPTEILETPPTGGTKMGENKNLRFVDIDDGFKVGDFDVYEMPNGSYKFVRIGVPVSGLAEEFPNFYTLFVNKQWAGDPNAFNSAFVGFNDIINNFPASQRTQIKTQIIGVMGTWQNVDDLAKFYEFKAALSGDAALRGYLQGNPTKMPEGWKLIRDGVGLTEANNASRLSKMIDDLGDNLDLQGFFTATTGALPIWNALNKVPIVVNYHDMVQWLEKLWYKKAVNFTPPSGANNQIVGSYSGSPIAQLDDITLNYSSLDNGPTPMTGSKVKEVSPQGGKAIGCEGGNCGLRDGACFAPGTLVHTPDGLKPIEDLQHSESIIAYDEVKQDTVISRIKSTTYRTWNKFRRIVADQTSILATNNHPFYLPDFCRYVPADSIRQGMKILTLAGTLLTVQQSVALDTSLTVYNLEVEEQHNYFVGQEGILVHNGPDHCAIQGRAGIPNDPAPTSLNSVIADWVPNKRQAFIDDLNGSDAFADYISGLPVNQQAAAVSLWEDIFIKGNKTILQIDPFDLPAMFTRMEAFKAVNATNFVKLIEDLPASRFDAILKHIDELPGKVTPADASLTNKFLNGLQNTHGNLATTNPSYIKDNIENLTANHLKVWAVAMTNGKTIKALDFNFLSAHLDNINDIDEMVRAMKKHQPSAGIVNALTGTPYESLINEIVLLRSQIRTKYLSILESNSTEAIKIQNALQARYGTRPTGTSWKDFLDDIGDMEIHHILAVQQLKLSEGVRFYMKNYNGPNKLDYNTFLEPRNGIPLESLSGGVGSHASHNLYDECISLWIDSKWTVINAGSGTQTQKLAALHTEIMSISGKLKNALIDKCVNVPTGQPLTKVNDIFNVSAQASDQAKINAVQAIINNSNY